VAGYEAFSLFGTISLKGAKEVGNQLKQLDTQASGLAAGLYNTGTVFRQIGSNLKAIGASLTRSLTLPIVAVGTIIAKTGMDFEKQMVEAYAVMENLTDSVKRQMEDIALATSKISRFSPVELATGYQVLARAGMDAGAAMAALPLMAKYAQASTQDLDSATQSLVQAQNALGLASKDPQENLKNLTRVADVLTAADINAVGSAKDFANALNNDAAASARVAKKPIEEVVAVLMAFAMRGDTGSEAGTHFHMVLRDLQRATLKNKEAFKKYGVEVYDSTGKLNNMADILGDLDKAFEGLTDKQKRQALIDMGFQDRSIKAIQSLSGASEQIREYQKVLEGAAGTTEEVSKKQLQNFSDALRILKNRLSATSIEIFRTLKPTLEKVMGPGGALDKHGKRAQNLDKKFTDMHTKQQ